MRINAARLADQGHAELTSGLSREGVSEISNELRQLLADAFSLYIKTKNFHWHLSGIHFRDYHLLLDEHASQIFAITDDIAERARKIGGTTIHSIGEIARNQRLKDNDDEFIAAVEMMRELREDNQRFIDSLRATHSICEKYEDVATASFIEVWIDEAERRHWFLTEIVREL
jgi:starvation-inducible DNA-binding protein